MPALSGSQKAYKHARLGVLRLGAGRLDYYTPQAWAISIASSDRRGDLKRGSLRIDQSEGRYDTASFTIVSGTAPSVGQEVLIGLGETRHNREFGGRIQRVRQRWTDPAGENTVYDCQAVGWEWDLDRKLVCKKYVSQRAETIILDILSTYTSGFTSLHLQTGFDTMTIAFRFEPVTRCLDRLAQEVGAFWYVDPHKDLHFATSESLGYAPETLSETATQTFRSLACETDYSQVRTRVYVEGRETQVVAECPVGIARIPLADDLGVPDSGTGDEYLLADGTLYSIDLTWGAWEYWGAIVAGGLMTYVLVDKGGIFTDESGDPAAEYDAFPGAAGVGDGLYLGHSVAWQDCAFTVVVPAVFDVEIVWEYWNGAAWVALTTSQEPAWTAQGTSLLQFVPPADWASSTVDSKSAYWVRGYLSSVTTMTTQPVVAGTWRGINTGETAIFVSSCTGSSGSFDGEAYWAAISGSHAVYGTYDATYGSYSDIAMAGIIGGVTAHTAYGDRWEHPHQFRLKSPTDTVTLVIPKGARASIARSQEDSTAQTALTALEGGDGIRDGYAQDLALNSTACATRGLAELALYKNPIDTLTYQTRDRNVRPGRSLAVNFSNTPNSAMNGTYTIRSVTLADEGDREGLPPWRSVTASTAAAQDLIPMLRRLEEHAGARAPR